MTAQEEDKLEKMVTGQEICEALSISHDTLCRWQKSRDFPLPVLRNKKLLRFRRKDYEDWLTYQQSLNKKQRNKRTRMRSLDKAEK